MAKAKKKKEKLHPILLGILEEVSEDLRDEETTNPKKLGYNADQHTGFVHYAALTKLCRLHIEARYYDRHLGDFKVSLMFRNPVTFSTPRSRTYNVKKDGSVNSKGIIKAVREHHKEMDRLQGRENATNMARRTENVRLQKIINLELQIPEDWRAVVDQADSRICIQRDPVEDTSGYYEGGKVWTTNDSLCVSEDNEVSGKLTLKRLSLPVLNKILKILADG